MLYFKNVYIYFLSLKKIILKKFIEFFFSTKYYNKSLETVIPQQVYHSPNPFLLSIIKTYKKQSFKINEIDPNIFWSRKKRAMVVLPLPIPPVKPTVNMVHLNMLVT